MFGVPYRSPSGRIIIVEMIFPISQKVKTLPI
jgi:hypothetical protein